MLVTLQELKDYLKISDTENDTKLNLVLTQADEYIKSQCERNFEYGTYTEKVRIANGVLFLKERPVESITEVIDVSGYEYSVWDFNSETGEVYLEEQIDSIAEVTYVGGYQSIPNDLKMAVIRLAEYLFNNPEGVKNVNFEGVTVAYTDTLVLVQQVIYRYGGFPIV